MSMLGPFEVRRENGPVLRLPKKAQALLAILAIGGERAVSRDQLATLLWGNSATEQARQSLRQCLTSLRNVLGADADRVLYTDIANVAWLGASSISLDTNVFATLCRSDDLDDLAQAAQLYRGELLSELHIPVEPFERWLTIERQKFAGLRLTLLEKLAATQARAGRSEEAIATARHLVALDPLQEEAHCLAMRLLAEAGNRSAALVQYDECVRVLRDELGIEPDAETTSLADAIRDGSLTKEAPAHVGNAAAATLVLPDKPSIVVLPFANLSSDGAQGYFVQGLVEDITVALGREKWLFVIASPSAVAAGSDTADLRSIGARLGVGYVLRGSVRLDAGRVLVVVQLNDAARGAHIWSERFQDQVDNLFALQERLTTKVAAMIAPALMSVEIERATHKPTENLTAFDLYLRALPRFRSSRAENDEALRLLAKAVELDPTYANAYGLASRCFQFRRMFDWLEPGDAAMAEGARFARHAIEIGRNNSEALWMGGLALVHLSDDIDHGLGAIERSLLLNPNSANAWIGSCLVNAYLGNAELAIDHFHRAQRLNPLDLSQHLHWNTIAWAYLSAGRYEAAADAAERTLHVQPDYLPGLRLKVVTCGLLGRTDAGRAALQRLLAVQPTCSITWLRQFLQGMLQRNPVALESYLEGARRMGVPESVESPSSR